MPQYSFYKLLRIVTESHSAIACCSIYNLESIQGVLAAAELECAPVILSIGNEATQHLKLSELGTAALYAASETIVPTMVHLNHGHSMDRILQALDLGFKSVMFDGSELSLEENILHTSYAAQLAHTAGAAIEGEIGPIYGHKMKAVGKPDMQWEKFLTQAEFFVKETGVDILAVSIPQEGLAAPEDVGRLARRLSTPLCIHKANRLGPDGAKLMAEQGAIKINFHSEIKQAMLQGLLKDTKDIFTMNSNAQKMLTTLVRNKIIAMKRPPKTE